MPPVGMLRERANTWPKTISHSSGWMARVNNSVGSWRSLRMSMSAIAPTFDR